MKSRRYLALVAVVSLIPVPHVPLVPARITVFAAASLTEAFQDIGQEFAQRNAGIAVQFNFAGSQQLAAQLEQGAAADLFASADQRWMTWVVERSLVEGRPRVFARNQLVVIIPRTNSARIQNLPGLARKGLKLVLAAEAVPAGKYTRDMLQNLSSLPGYGEDFARRVVSNVVSNEETVRGVVAKVQLGEADAGIVYRTDVTSDVSRFISVLEIPEAQNVVAAYPVALVRGSRHAAEAKALLDYIVSTEGQAILRRHGFQPVTAGP
ncbi:MAG: molybdate ABC transporter substrate-binding protein [Gemmatimonadota bacterium]